MKAVYIERTGTLARRTHDLVFLGNEVAVPPAIQNDLVALNSAFETTRYPEPGEEAIPVDETTEADAEQDLEAGRRVFQWIEQQLTAGPFQV